MAAYVICFLFLSNQISAIKFNENNVEMAFSHQFVAAVVYRTNEELVTLGAVVSPHWVLTVAHVFPSDTFGLDFSKYMIVAGRPWTKYLPVFALTHPAFTWGIHTAEDFTLFRVEEEINTRPVLILAGRFPWNFVECDFIYWSGGQLNMFLKGLLRSIPVEATVLQNCLTTRKRRANGLNQFYLDDILCAKADKRHLSFCTGAEGGILFCQNLLVGLLVRDKWCHGKTANFTDVGRYTNWLQSRVTDGNFVQLKICEASAGNAIAATTFAVVCFSSGVLIGGPYTHSV